MAYISSFADMRLSRGIEKPMECTPIVDHQGFFRGYYVDVADRGPDDVIVNNDVYGGLLPINGQSPEELVSFLREELDSFSPQCTRVLIPKGELLTSLKALCDEDLRIQTPTPEKLSTMLLTNIEFIKNKFKLDDINPYQWSPELTVAAGLILMREAVLSDKKLPLMCMLCPLWLESRRQLQYKSMKDVNTFTDFKIKLWLDRCTRRDGSVVNQLWDNSDDYDDDNDDYHHKAKRGSHRLTIPKKPTNKHSYITKYETTTSQGSQGGVSSLSSFQEQDGGCYQVMSRTDGIIDIRNKSGPALVNHVIEVLKKVVTEPIPSTSDPVGNNSPKKYIPKRPRGRLNHMIKKLQMFLEDENPMLSSIKAQILLRNHEADILPDPRELFSRLKVKKTNKESSEEYNKSCSNLMKLIWLCGRFNLPTIITIPRKTMCDFTPQSVWWDFFQTNKAHVPVNAMMCFSSHVWQDLKRLYSTVVVSTTSIRSSNTHARIDDDDFTAFNSSSLREVLTKSQVTMDIFQKECLDMLQVSSLSDARIVLEEFASNVQRFAAKLHGAISLLRDSRLLREDILSHAASTWNKVMGSVKLCATFYTILNDGSNFQFAVEANRLMSSVRMLTTHFAPDIYPWAHCASLCNRSISGYALLGYRDRDGSYDLVDVPFVVKNIEGLGEDFLVTLVENESTSSSLPFSVLCRSQFQALTEKAFSYTMTLLTSSTPTMNEVRQVQLLVRSLSTHNRGSNHMPFTFGGDTFRGRSRSRSRSPSPHQERRYSLDRNIDRNMSSSSKSSNASTSVVLPLKVGHVLKATCKIPQIRLTMALYNDAKGNLSRNLVPPMKAYVIRMLKLYWYPVLPFPIQQVLAADDENSGSGSGEGNAAASADAGESGKSTGVVFDALLQAWDSNIPAALDLQFKCEILETDIQALTNGFERPPCESSILNIEECKSSIEDVCAEISSFTKKELIRVMCLISEGGRDILRENGLSHRPSAVAMVWAILRGVNDSNWARNYEKGFQ